MNIAEKDQLAAVARDAGHVAKEVSQYKYLPEKNQQAFNAGVHMAREMIRAGMPPEALVKEVPLMRAMYEGVLATLEAFIAGAKPMDDWS